MFSPRHPWLAAALRTVCALTLGLGVNITFASDKPLEYLDEVTGATITVVGHPLVFVHGCASFASHACDYVTLAAASVDQSGKVSDVLVAYFWSSGSAGDSSLGRKPIVLQLKEQRVVLSPELRSAWDAGIGVPIHRPPFGDAAPCLYAVDLVTIRNIAESSGLVLYGGNDASKKYELLEDRLGALKEFVSRVTSTR